MERYNCTLGRYYNSEPVVNSKMAKIKNSKMMRSLKRGFCGGDDEDIRKSSQRLMDCLDRDERPGRTLKVIT